MPDYVIIDAHVHLWERQAGMVNGMPVYDLGNGKSSFLGGVRQMMPPYMEDGRNTVERLIANMDYAGVCGCAVTQEYMDGNQDEYLLRVKEKYPDRFRITALYEDENMSGEAGIERMISNDCRGSSGSTINSFSQNDQESFSKIETGIKNDSYGTDSEKKRVENIDRQYGENSRRYRLAGFDGVKISACRLKNKDLTTHIDVFKAAEAAGKYISIDMADGDEQTDSMREVIEQCPDLRIAIGHFGMVTTPGWQKQIELARYKNVYIESGGLTWLFHKEFYPYPSAMDAILEARDICGIGKLMWGSDYPRTMTDITYKSAVRFILESVKLTDNEKRAFLGENAVKFYGFEGLKPLQEIANML